uniref:Uncharacterized protein n=1 Tax=Amphilophus citrinellus TaxID=61819 RepID=A0A3Q0SHF7_AMPCI
MRLFGIYQVRSRARVWRGFSGPAHKFVSFHPNTNIPEYEYLDVNTKPFHVGSFRKEWLSRLKPNEYSYEEGDEDEFNAKFAKEMGVGAETMAELKAVCSVDSLRCHPEDQQPDTELVPPDVTLRTLVYDLYSLNTNYESVKYSSVA